MRKQPILTRPSQFEKWLNKNGTEGKHKKAEKESRIIYGVVMNFEGRPSKFATVKEDYQHFARFTEQLINDSFEFDRVFPTGFISYLELSPFETTPRRIHLSKLPEETIYLSLGDPDFFENLARANEEYQRIVAQK